MRDFTTIPILLTSKNDTVTASEGQCDCACVATTPLTKSLQLSSSTPSYRLATPFEPTPLTDDFHTIATDHVSAVVLNDTAVFLAQHFQQPRQLDDIPQSWQTAWGENNIRITLDGLVETGLLVPQESEPFVLQEKATTLTAWLHITDRCNLRCAYCYLPHKREDMTVEIGRSAIESTFRSAPIHGYEQVKFKYAGGEPLIKFGTVRQLHRHAQRLAQEYSLSLDGVVLSNGTLLTPAIVTELQLLGLRLMISLDGLAEHHNSQRFYANQHGSFADVQRGIDHALSLGLVPDISVTVSSRNAEGLPTLISWILARDLPFSLNFYRENNYSASFNDLRLEEEKIIAGTYLSRKKKAANHVSGNIGVQVVVPLPLFVQLAVTMSDPPTVTSTKPSILRPCV